MKWPECLRTKLGICPVVTLMAGVNYTLKNHTCDHFIFKLTTKFSNMTLYTCLTFATSIHRSLLSSFSSWAASPYIPAAKQARWSILCSSLPYLRICKGWNFFWTTKVFAQKISRRQWFAEMIREVQNRNPGLPKSKRASFWQILLYYPADSLHLCNVSESRGRDLDQLLLDVKCCFVKQCFRLKSLTFKKIINPCACKEKRYIERPQFKVNSTSIKFDLLISMKMLFEI